MTLSPDDSEVRSDNAIPARKRDANLDLPLRAFHILKCENSETLEGADLFWTFERSGVVGRATAADLGPAGLRSILLESGGAPRLLPSVGARALASTDSQFYPAPQYGLRSPQLALEKAMSLSMSLFHARVSAET